MSIRLIQAVFPRRLSATIKSAAEDCDPIDVKTVDSGEAETEMAEILIAADHSQRVLDALQTALEGEQGWRINVLPVEITLPRLSDEELARQKSNREVSARDEIYEDVAAGTQIDANFVLLTLISAIVATIGLNEDNVAVIIGAMVIAPLLGPNLAFSLGVALGDLALMRRAAATSALGIGVGLALAVLLGLVLPANLDSVELMRRTHVWYGDVVLALASGAAAALSVTTRVASTLVGVMVAVALLPPIIAVGFFAGGGHVTASFGAFILLATNIVCLNLTSQLVFIWKGVRPRKWLEQRAANDAIRINLIVLGLLAVLLIGIIYVWTRFFG